MTDPSLHPTRTERMLALLDLISSEEQERFDAHLVECSSCRERMADARDELHRITMQEHVPASILARLDRLRLVMGARESALIERHLRTCGTCSEALIAAGELRMSPAQQTLERPRWNIRLFGWGLGFAFAVLLFLVFWPRGTERLDRNAEMATGPDTTAQPKMPPSAEPGRPAAPARDNVADEQVVHLALARIGDTGALALRTQQRDVSVELPSIGTAGRTRLLRLRIPALPLLDPSHRLEIRLISPGDSVLATHKSLPGELDKRPVLEVRSRQKWTAGDYRVEIIDLTPPEPGFEPEVVSLPFRITAP